MSYAHQTAQSHSDAWRWSSSPQTIVLAKKLREKFIRPFDRSYLIFESYRNTIITVCAWWIFQLVGHSVIFHRFCLVIALRIAVVSSSFFFRPTMKCRSFMNETRRWAMKRKKCNSLLSMTLRRSNFFFAPKWFSVHIHTNNDLLISVFENAKLEKNSFEWL